MKGLNISATLNAFRALKSPSLLLPHHTVSSFDALPYPLSSAFPANADIRAVVLDKDNCFAIPHELDVYGAYKARFELLKKEFPGNRLLVVSNSSGTDDDIGHVEATLLQQTLHTPILHHTTKKPGCHNQILTHFLSDPTTTVTSASHIAIIGDRLFTDVLMANMMGSWSIWIRDGVKGRVEMGEKAHYRGVFAGVERGLEGWMRGGLGWRPPMPVVEKE
ncbi:mitochondrial PGP phosphatase-domain-containing protein [Peziza echinospora]|nr:mitochondrial PGP phosphatase-domain-containing protein [Peziza echinospora]